MFLGDAEIQRRLDDGSLLVDPILGELELGGFCGIDLHLDSEFVTFASDPPSSQLNYGRAMRTSSSLSKPVVCEPGTGVLGITLEIVRLPVDLMGVLFASPALGRFGVLTPTTSVGPGWGGKLAIPIQNIASSSIELRPGMRIATLALAEVRTGPEDSALQGSAEAGLPAGQGPISLADDEAMRRFEELQAERTRARRRPSPRPALPALWNEVQAEKGAGRGRPFEELLQAIIETIRGLTLIRRNARLQAEELDLYVANDIRDGFWRIIGTPIIVECKSSPKTLEAKEINLLVQKLQAIGPDAKTAILVTLGGITRGAKTRMRENRQLGKYVLVLEADALEDIVNGADAASQIEQSYNRLMLL